MVDGEPVLRKRAGQFLAGQARLRQPMPISRPCFNRSSPRWAGVRLQKVIGDFGDHHPGRARRSSPRGEVGVPQSFGDPAPCLCAGAGPRTCGLGVRSHVRADVWHRRYQSTGPNAGWQRVPHSQAINLDDLHPHHVELPVEGDGELKRMGDPQRTIHE